MGLFARSVVTPTRRAIDFSGDGPNNDDRPVSQAPGAAGMVRIAINGLPILEIEPQRDTSCRDNVVGGRDAFVLADHNLSDFAGAMLCELMIEVAGTDAASRFRD